MNKYGHWFTFADFDITQYYGFVYLIINNTNDRKYIGQKRFNAGTIPWHKYTGTQKDLNIDIKQYGKDQFSFIILELVSGTQQNLDFAEVQLQISNNVLKSFLPNGTKEFYNLHIHRVGFVCTNRSKKVYHETSTAKIVYFSATDTILDGYVKGVPEHTKDKNRIANSNRKIIHNTLTNETIFIKIDDEVPEQYELGRSAAEIADRIKNKTTTKGKTPYHCPITDHEILIGSADIIPAGYIKGQSTSHRELAVKDQNGDKNANADKTIYELKNKRTKEIFKGTTSAFLEKYGKMQVSHVKHGIEKSVHGWEIIGINGTRVRLILNICPDAIYKSKFRYIEISE